MSTVYVDIRNAVIPVLSAAIFRLFSSGWGASDELLYHLLSPCCDCDDTTVGDDLEIKRFSEMYTDLVDSYGRVQNPPPYGPYVSLFFNRFTYFALFPKRNLFVISDARGCKQK